MAALKKKAQEMQRLLGRRIFLFSSIFFTNQIFLGIL
jgi:hypothetical protein